MSTNNRELAQKIYDLMSGAIAPEECKPVNGHEIANEFAEGAPCELAYREVYEACGRLGERINVPFGEDSDIETVLDGMTEIQERLCLKMFEYGQMFAESKEEK